MSYLETYRENNDPNICLSEKFVKDQVPDFDSGSGFGCRYGCIYCNQQAMDKDSNGNNIAGALYPAVDGGVSINPDLFFNKYRVKTYDESQLVTDLIRYPYWNPDSPVILYNFSDPSLNWQKSINLAKRLVNEAGQRGPIQFITKGAIDTQSVASFRELQTQGGKPIVLVTYSGMPTSVEPIPGKIRINTMGKLKSAGIPVIMSMRPIVMGVNGELNQVEQVLRQAGDLPTIITVGGLYVYQPLTIEAFRKAGYELQEPYKSWNYPIRKILSPGYRDSVRSLARSIGDKAPIYNHTTCAASTIMTTEYNQPTPDTFAHWAGGEKDGFEYCETYCHPDQIVNCQRLNTVDVEKIKIAETMLKSMGYSNSVEHSKRLVGTLLIVDGSLPVSELYPIVRATGLKVFNLPNENGVIYRTNQAIKEDLQDESCHIVRTLKAGQEWFVLLNHFPKNDEKLSQLYVRSRNQARITAFDVPSLHNRGKIMQQILDVCDGTCSLGDIDNFVGL